MPRGDRTGPAGAGPMTGRGAGLCGGYPTPGYMNPTAAQPGSTGGFGFGRGRVWFGGGRGGWGGGRGWGGGGRGWRHRFWATGVPGWAVGGYGYPAFGGWPYPAMSEPTASEETELLKEQAEILRQELKDIEERIDTLEKAQVQQGEQE